MLDFFDFFLVGSLFCGFITSLLLFTQSRFLRHANRLLGLVIFPMAWYALTNLMLKTGWMYKVPDLYAVGSPLYYLVGPCSYLYTRTIVMDESRFRKWDWLHFLPAILHCIELLPFYFSDAAIKKQAIESLAYRFNGSRQVPALWHHAARPVHVIIYLVFQWLFLFKALNRRNSYAIHEAIFGKIRYWLFSFTALITVVVIGVVVQLFLSARVLDAPISFFAANWHMRIPISFAFFAVSAYLFLQPEILYGTLKAIPGDAAPPAGEATMAIPELTDTNPVVEQPKDEEPVMRKGTLLQPELVADYYTRIENHLQLHQSFRRQGLTIHQLASELAMPEHHLSYVLNYHYRQRFSDFINQHRVDYIKELLKTEEWRKMKIETLATEAGFSSRSAFFAAFKKITGLTPADYARQIGQV
ncbi:MAG: AraC family transcriptional regulator [Chitinophagaceae bacterium]